MSTEGALDRLRSAPWLGTAARFFKVLDGDQGRTRAVGGIVRDTLLGIAWARTDIDMATELLPQEVMARAGKAGFGVHPTGLEHGTVTLVAGGVVAEVTTLRKDIETFGRHAEVRFGTDWRADAARRDFTMNALYAGADGSLFDPLEGLADCLARRVRFIGDADARIAEDRLRVYRYFRFCATHGEEMFDDEALAACGRAAATLGQLSAERVGSEMLKLLDAPRCTRALEAMCKLSILWPDLIPPAALAVLGRLNAGDAASRMAIFVAQGTSISLLQTRWRLSNGLRRQVEQLARGASLAAEGKLKELVYRLPEQKEEAIRIAAALGNWPEERTLAATREAAGYAPGAFPLKGEDLIAAGVSRGPALGAALRRLERDWIESGFELGKQALLARLGQT